jgi:hypothetical protein
MLRVEELGEDLGGFFAVDPGDSVRVTSVESGLEEEEGERTRRWWSEQLL